MKKLQLAAAVAGALGFLTMAESASAQELGAELRGATMQVEFDSGAMNTVTFNPDGTAVIQGQTETVNGRWFVQSQRLCLEATGRRECWPYQSAFQNGQTVTLTSDCASTSRWTALSTAQPPARSGERG